MAEAYRCSCDRVFTRKPELLIHQYAERHAKAPVRIVRQLGAVMDAELKRGAPLAPPETPTPTGEDVAKEARVYARYTLRMPLDAAERTLSRALWGFEQERKSARTIELDTWEEWLQPGQSAPVLVEWQAQRGYGPHKLRYATTGQYYEPRLARDPTVTLNDWNSNVKVVVQAHILQYAHAGPGGPTVTVLVDDDQFPWLKGQRLPSERERTLEFAVAPSSRCNRDGDPTEAKTSYIRAEGGGVHWETESFALGALFNLRKDDYALEKACVQPSTDMIAAVVLADGQRGQRLMLKRRIGGAFVDYPRTLSAAPMYVEARVIDADVRPIESTYRLRVWVDGHIVSLHTRHRSTSDGGCRSCALDIFEGHRSESLGAGHHPLFGGGSVYSIFYEAPIVPSVRAYIDRVQEDIPPPLHGIHVITDLVTQMLYF